MAGSPLAIGNLWDVTDKDIDRFAKSVLEKCLEEEEEEEGGGTLSAQSIMRGRKACKLTSLTGMAMVYYGLPRSLVREWMTSKTG